MILSKRVNSQPCSFAVKGTGSSSCSSLLHIPTGHVSFPPIIEDDNDYSKLWTEIWTSIVKKGEDPGKEKHVHEKLQKGDHIKQRKKKKKVDEQQKKVSKLHVFILFTMKRRRYKIKSE